MTPLTTVLPDHEQVDQYDEPGHSEFALRETALTRKIDRFVVVIGEVFHWIWVALLVVIIFNVVLRYAFSRGMIELEELQWYLYGVGWLMGLSYTFVFDGHVRVDVLHDRLSYRNKLRFELIGLLLLFLPFIVFVIVCALPFVELSWTTNERSTSANGLPARWLVKGFLLLGFVFLALTGISRLIKVVVSMVHGAPGPARVHSKGVA
ncbi:MAG: TRAP transporter small permease subunit [Aestuariivirgaceae bacterium]